MEHDAVGQYTMIQSSQEPNIWNSSYSGHRLSAKKILTHSKTPLVHPLPDFLRKCLNN